MHAYTMISLREDREALDREAGPASRAPRCIRTARHYVLETVREELAEEQQPGKGVAP